MNEYDIRPRAIFDEYLEISQNDIPKYFGNAEDFVRVNCPICNEAGQIAAFTKHGFDYVTCPACESLYVSPRPTSEMINRFYRESDSSRYWAEFFFPLTAEARRIHIFEPRAQMIVDLVKRFGETRGPLTLVDVGAGIGLFLEAAKATNQFAQVLGIEPGRDLAKVCRSRGHEVLEKPVEAVLAEELQASVVTSFEVFEHLYDPASFIKSMSLLLDKNGLLIFTTLSVTGFDLQVLWDQSKSISPPHHINFISYHGVRQLMARCGFELLDISTPGKLDVDIVCNMLRENASLDIPRFARTLFRVSESHGNSHILAEFQKFLSNSALSSHVCIVARKI